ncbi:MAG: YHYH protein, partial [Bacteroidota bacterium]
SLSPLLPKYSAMRVKFSLSLFILLLASAALSAHAGGHDHPKPEWTVGDLSVLSPAEQAWMLERAQQLSMQGEAISTTAYWGLLGGLTILLILIARITKSTNWRLTAGALGAISLGLIACGEVGEGEIDVPVNPPSVMVPANDVEVLAPLFTQFDGVSTRTDDEWFYISSDGLPAHDMMIGITNWQQQVPIDQNYTDDNSWAIPLQPALADNPLSTRTNLLKGAIAIAVNGIPIFNPLNNRGEDANEIGELDQWGGHCGRADDYHYHLPPVHLQATVGPDQPIAYAVDGFPVYGETTEPLDEYLGRFTEDSAYQYHTIQEYPYFIAGMRGRVNLDPQTNAPENQVIPQARTQELRPATSPLRGAVITDFVSHGNNAYSLTYTLDGDTFVINYSWDPTGLYTYEFVGPDGQSTVETYRR